MKREWNMFISKFQCSSGAALGWKLIKAALFCSLEIWTIYSKRYDKPKNIFFKNAGVYDGFVERISDWESGEGTYVSHCSNFSYKLCSNSLKIDYDHSLGARDVCFSKIGNFLLKTLKQTNGTKISEHLIFYGSCLQSLLKLCGLASHKPSACI